MLFGTIRSLFKNDKLKLHAMDWIMATDVAVESTKGKKFYVVEWFREFSVKQSTKSL